MDNNKTVKYVFISVAILLAVFVTILSFVLLPVVFFNGLIAVAVFFIICILVGLYLKIKRPKENHMLKVITWGLFYVSLLLALIIGSIMAWFYFYYFKNN